MNNEKGGIIFKMIIIPAGVALIAGFFYLGYYMGTHQHRSGASGELASPLPEIAPGSDQKREEFTFYKTLTDQNDKTVSIDLQPRPVREEIKSEKQQPAAAQKAIPVPSLPKEKRTEINPGKDTQSSAKPAQAASKQSKQSSKKQPAAASKSVKPHYTVQTASYQDRAQAEDEVRRLKKRGFAAFIVSSEMPGKGMRHRVRIGSFLNKAAAEKLQRTIHEKERILTIVVLD